MRQSRFFRGAGGDAALDFHRRLSGPGPFLLCLGALPLLWLLAQIR